jgi:hypothetical protein
MSSGCIGQLSFGFAVLVYIVSVPCMEHASHREIEVVFSPTVMKEMGALNPSGSKVELMSFVVSPRHVSTMIIVGTIPYKRSTGC